MPTLAELWDSSDTGLKSDLNDRLEQAKEAYRKQHGKELPVTSGFRTYEQQAALASKPNPYPVARPGTSMHESGDAVDIGKDVPDSFLNQYGLHRPFKNDPVHVQVMPSAKGTQSLASLWDQVDVGDKNTQPEIKSETKSTIQDIFNAKKEMGQRVAGGLDTLLGIVPQAVSAATYASARAAQRSPEEATKFSEQMGSYFEPKIGQALGVQNTEAYKHPLGKAPGQIAEYVNHLSNVLGLTPEQISEKTGIPASDIRNMAFTASIGAPEALIAAKEALPAVQIVKNESRVANQLNNQLQQKGAQNAGAAATVNKSVLDQAIQTATPELAAELKTVSPSDLNPEVLSRHLEADSLPIPVRLTKGQALQDPNIISKERNERGVKEQYVEHFNQQNKDLLANAQAIKERTAPNVFTTDYVDDAGNAINFVNDIKKANVDATRTAYKDLESLGGGKFPINAKEFGKNALQALTKGEESEFLPDVFKRRIDEYANGTKEMNFDNFENLRTQIAKASRATDDGNVRHALSVVRQELENLPMPGASAELKTAADNARSLAKHDFELENSNDLYNKVVNGKADTKDFIQNFVVRSKNSDFANSLELLKDNPQAIEHLRSGTLDYLTREATDASGNFSTAKFNKAINKMDVDGKLDTLFGGDAQMLRNLVKTGQYVEARPRGAFVNESNTFVAGAKALAASGLEKALNATTANIVPIGTMGREALQSNAIRKQTKEALKPGAGVKLSDIGKP